MDYETALLNILTCPKSNPYAKAYAKAGRGMTGHHQVVQIRYILNNIGSWRGPKAKETREALKGLLPRL